MDKYPAAKVMILPVAAIVGCFLSLLLVCAMKQLLVGTLRPGKLHCTRGISYAGGSTSSGVDSDVDAV